MSACLDFRPCRLSRISIRQIFVYWTIGTWSLRNQSFLVVDPLKYVYAKFEPLYSTFRKLLSFEGTSSINDICVIFVVSHITGTHFFQSTDFFLCWFAVFIWKRSIHGLMPKDFCLLRLSFQEEGVDSSYKDFSKRATTSTIVGSKGDKVINLEIGFARSIFMLGGIRGMVFNKVSPISFQR